MFSDGLPFDIPDSDHAPAPKPLAPYFDAEQTSADIYLAIPHHRERGLNVSIAERNADTRYVSEVVNLRDENTGSSEKPVQLARKNMRFLVEGESREGCTYLRLARIKRTAAGTLQTRPSIYPSTAGYRRQRIFNRHYAAAHRDPFSEEQHSRRRPTAAERQPGRLHRRGYRQLLAPLHGQQSSPRAAAFLRDGEGPSGETLPRAFRPRRFTLHVFLKIQPRDLPAYDHDGLGPCFADLDEKVRELLENCGAQ